MISDRLEDGNGLSAVCHDRFRAHGRGSDDLAMLECGWQCPGVTASKAHAVQPRRFALLYMTTN